MDTCYKEHYLQFEEYIRSQNASYDFESIKKAFECCVEAHKGQFRCSKEEFYIHPVNVAKIVAQLGLDNDAVVASLLHDTVEDTQITLDYVKKEFGEEVALLVDGVT